MIDDLRLWSLLTLQALALEREPETTGVFRLHLFAQKALTKSELESNISALPKMGVLLGSRVGELGS